MLSFTILENDKTRRLGPKETLNSCVPIYLIGLPFLQEFANKNSSGNPHFIELKSYMHVGMSIKCLEASQMLEMDEIRQYANALCGLLPEFTIMDESEISRIVVLQNQHRFVDRWIQGYEKKLNVRSFQSVE